jgi:serine/threonine protein kinase
MKVKQTAKGVKILKVRIADFGISKQLFQAQQTKTLIGTPVYMAREMFMGAYDSKVDVYSFGVMIAECLCRRLPRQNDPFTVNELVSVAKDNPVRCDLVDLQQRCVKPHPDMRPSMDEVVEALEDIVVKYWA